jgi:hypothetical protein
MRSSDVYVDVNIKQQPNNAADSARLYGELKRAAEEEVVSATINKFGAYNEVEVVRVDTWEDYSTQKKHYRFLFKVNGKTYDIKTDLFPDRTHTRGAAYEVNRAILSEVFEKSIKELMKYPRG